MGIKAHYLQDKNQEKFYPYAHADAAFTRDGEKVGDVLDSLTNSAQIQSDWNTTDSSDKSYIKNKPSSLPANGGNADTVGGHTVEVNVPANAVFTDTKPVTMKGATSSTSGSAGYVPAPASGANTKYLRGDGTWQTPPDTNTTYSVATTSADGLMSSSDKSKLDGIASGANKYTHPSYTSHTSGLYKVTVDSTGHVSGATAVTKSDITALGIPGQDTNTTYSNMTAATADAAGKSGLVPAPSAGSQTKFLRGDGTWQTPTNTTYSTMKGATSSAAGSSGLVPAPASGQQGTFLRGDGTWANPAKTTYNVATTSANGLMSSSDKSKLDGIADGANKYTHPSYTAKSSGLYKVTVDSTGHVSATASVTKSDITALGIPGSDTNTWTALKGATTDADGTAGYAPAPTKGSANRYLRSDGTWSVPPDTNTTYSTGNATTAGITKLYTGTGTATDGSMTQNAITTALNGKASSSHTHNYAGSANAGGSANSAVKLDTSTAGSATQPVYFSEGKPVACTYTLGKSVPSNAVFTDTNTWIAFKGATTSTAGTAGYAPAPSAGAANRYLRSDGTWSVPPDTNTTDSTRTAATSSSAGKAGLVPAPSAGAQNKYLRGDGTWQTPPNTTYSAATTSAAGLMSASDKSKLDGIASGANKYTLPTASSTTLGGVKTTSTVSSTSGLTPCPIISGVPYYKDTNTTYSLSSFGITATAAELNYVDGVTSNIQTQLNNKVNNSIVSDEVTQSDINALFS